jgi:hypothetical protein
MSLIIRIAFVVLCACAGSVAGTTQFADPAASYQSAFE